MIAVSLRTVAIAAAIAVSTGASAQFRHDEKPHGQSKASPGPDTPVTERTPGRHDDRPHGQPQKKVTPAKPAAEKADGDKKESRK